MNLKKVQSWLVTLVMLLALIPPAALAAAEQVYTLTVKHVYQNIAEDGTPGDEMEYEEATMEVSLPFGADITNGGNQKITPLEIFEIGGKRYGLRREDAMGVESSTDFDFTVNANGEIESGSMPANDVVITYYYVEVFTVTYLPGDYGLWDTIITPNLYHGDDTPPFDFDDVVGIDDYTFLGWDIEDDNGVNIIPNEDLHDRTVTGNVTYVAQWEEKDYAYDVTYVWSVEQPNDFTKIIPQGAKDLQPGSEHPVDTTFTSGTVVESRDACGNIDGKWTFSGWRLGNTPAPATLTMDGDKELVGTWSYEWIGVSIYDVTYTWTNAPTSEDVAATLVPTLPTGEENLRNNSPYTVDTTFSSETAISSYDEHGNLVGTWTFSGWKLGTDPAPATLTINSNKELVGEWTFTPVEVAAPEVTTYSIAYYYGGEMDEALTESNLPGEVGEEISDFEHKFKDGFAFDYANSILLGEDPAENVLEVHYKPDTGDGGNNGGDNTGITVEISVAPDAPAFLRDNASKIKVIGAELNATAGQKVELKISTPSTAALTAAETALAAMNTTSYDTANMIPLEISLEVDGVEQGKLAYQIALTMPISPSIVAANLCILHISKDGTVELITPKDEGDGTCTFTVTHFSTFAFVAQVPAEPTAPTTPATPETPPTSGGSSGNGSGSDGGGDYDNSDATPPTTTINRSQTPPTVPLPETVNGMNEKRPLNDLPNTGGAAKKVSSAAGFLAILGGLLLGLIGLKKDDEE